MFTRTMDYLDTKKELRNHIIMMVGYVLVAVAIVMAALVLLYQAYGFGLGKNGDVIQSGLTFFSSQPNPADIYVDGKRQSVTTNTRLVLPSGIYQVKLTRNGYHEWQRTINLEGGSVEHYDYPFLFPQKLVTKKIQTLEAAPGFTTQSPDRRWLLIQQPGKIADFTVYDLKNPDKAAIPLSLPANLLTKAANGEAWQIGEWASDNQHILLQHDYDGRTEFIMLDRANPDKSFNINTSLGVTATKLTLRDKKYDQYYLYDAPAGILRSISLKNPVAVEVLQHVLAYKSYGNDTVLFTTDNKTPKGKALVKLITLNDQKVITVRSLPLSTGYVLDLAKYSGAMYVAAGATGDNRVYIYKDPVGQLAAQPDQAPVPQQVLHVEQPNYLSFSSSAQFIVAANGNRFGVYDNENKVGFNYTAQFPLDPPQSHASWMDGDRLVYVSGGKLVVFDYDNLNHQTLVPMSSSYLPAFTPDYKRLYAIAPSATPGQYELTVTSLLIPADQ